MAESFTSLTVTDRLTLGANVKIPLDNVQGLGGALSRKSALESPGFSGIPTAPTAASGTNTTQIATTAFVHGAVTNIIGGAPGALDTLNELAVALGNDANLATSVTTTMATKAPIANPTFTGTVSGITATMVGLGSVNNTSDAAKPISTAAQAALDLKAPLASAVLTGIPSAPTATSGTNTTQIATTAFVTSAVSTETSNRNTALDLKAPLANPTFTGTVGGITATMVGLGQVKNTSDAKKPCI